ncbi:MAG: hypothetical protein QXG63_02695 [Nitrososphaerales archaeon]
MDVIPKKAKRHEGADVKKSILSEVVWVVLKLVGLQYAVRAGMSLISMRNFLTLITQWS